VYLEYFGLKEMPFDLAPNPRFLFYSPKHREAYNHVLYGIRERKGFVEFTGEVGCGKTTLCRAILRELGEEYATALILNPVMEPDHLLQAVATEFGLQVKGMDRFETLSTLNHFLIDLLAQGREAVLIIDEAQDMSTDLLEQIRLLSNLETDDRKLLQILLMGQTELRDRLREHQLRQLRQRITVRFHLDPLTWREMSPYVQHRLHVAGGNGRPCFTRTALRSIFRHTEGIPRLVNAVCDKCLLAAYVQRRSVIDWPVARAAIRELEGKIDV
jgi:general secretion pathway protein A